MIFLDAVIAAMPAAGLPNHVIDICPDSFDKEVPYLHHEIMAHNRELFGESFLVHCWSSETEKNRETLSASIRSFVF